MQKIKNKFGDKITFLLFSATVFFLVLIVISQLCLKNKKSRELFTKIDDYENISLEANADAAVGYVTVKLTSGNPSEKIEIWFNGEKTALFDEKEVKIKIYCSGVVEIKNDSGNIIKAEVKDTSDNVKLMLNNKSEVLNGIKVLCTVSLKS